MKSSNCALKQSKTNSPLGNHPDNLMPYGILATHGIGAHTCVAAPTRKTFFCRICDQINNWNHLYLSIFPIIYRVFRHSALAPNFSIDPIIRRGDMSSSVHSRECGEATAVSETFRPDLVAEIRKCGSKYIFTAVELVLV